MKTQKGMTMKATVVKNTRISEKFGYLELKCPDIAKEKNAGRFFMISPHSDNVYITDTLLKRPFAICDITSEETFTCLYMITGRGTKILSEALPGNHFLVTGPVGNFFKFEKDKKQDSRADGDAKDGKKLCPRDLPQPPDQKVERPERDKGGQQKNADRVKDYPMTAQIKDPIPLLRRSVRHSRPQNRKAPRRRSPAKDISDRIFPSRSTGARRRPPPFRKESGAATGRAWAWLPL